MINSSSPTNQRYLPYLSSAFVAVLIIQSVACSKMVALGSLTIAGGTLLFPISFIINDILTEVYGYQVAKKIIWTGFAAQALAATTFWLVGELPAASFWSNQSAYDTILGATPRIIIASFLAYLFGSFGNSIVLARMKAGAGASSNGKMHSRFVMSTIVGEALDSIIFITVAFAGVFATDDLLATMATIYVFKVVYEILALPLSTRIAAYVKNMEGVS